MGGKIGFCDKILMDGRALFGFGGWLWNCFKVHGRAGLIIGQTACQWHRRKE